MDTRYKPHNHSQNDISFQQAYENVSDTTVPATFTAAAQHATSDDYMPEQLPAQDHTIQDDTTLNTHSHPDTTELRSMGPTFGIETTAHSPTQNSDMTDNMSVELARLRRLQIARQGSLPSQLPPLPTSPGHPYVYNEDTGLLSPTGRGLGEGGSRERRQYVEDHRTGHFRRVDQQSRFNLFRRRKQQQPHTWQDTAARQPGTRLKAVADKVANLGGVIALIVQGTLGGLALLNILMTYIVGLPDWGGDLTNFLEYYGPVAMGLNRLYYALITISLLAACTRQANHAITDYEPKQLKLRRQDIVLIVFYLAAYIVSILCTPMDDELTYAYNRDHKFWVTQPLSSKFKSRMKLWHLMNVVRIVLCATAWILVCYQMRPLAHDAIIASKVEAQVKALLASSQNTHLPASPYRLTTARKDDVLPPAAADAPDLGSPPIRAAPDLHGSSSRRTASALAGDWSPSRSPLTPGRPGFSSS